MTYKSSFQDRAGQAAEAKAKALERYRARPQLDPKEAAERAAAGQQRAEAKAKQAAAKKAEKIASAQAKAAGDAAKAAGDAAKAAAAAPKTEAELKAARDAKYAKRKARK